AKEFYSNTFPSLNSKEYYTVYPPIAQALFTIGAYIAGSDLQIFSIVLKLFFVAFELGSIYFLIKLLAHFKINKAHVLIYALNPLIVIEFCGNLHFESAMIFFFIAAIYFLISNKLLFSSLLFACSIASKLLTLIFLIFLIRRLGWKKAIQYFILVGLFTALLFLPIVASFGIENFAKSLNLYFQKFEFNASIYYIARQIGYWKKGFNLIAVIGPALGIVSLISILLIFFFEKAKDFQSYFQICLFAICIYLLFTTTVHPWYLGLAILCSVFSKYKFVLLWSFLICLTYINYSFPEYHEVLWIVALEYILVIGFFLYELNINIAFQAKFEKDVRR
ncbi:MAG: mannosyltransferase, partial [Bacteroidota bacterium]